MSAAQGFAAQLGIHTADPVTKAYEFLSESLVLTETFVESGGIRGTRSHPKEAVRQGTRTVGGMISMHPTPVQLADLLPHIMGLAGSGTTFALGDTFSDLYIAVDRVTKVFTYSGCKINKATFRGSSGQPLLLELDILGIDESIGNAGTFPSLSIDVTTSMFMFSDLVLVLNSGTYQCFDFELTIDNMLDSNRIFNSLVRTSIPAQDRVVSFSASLPYGDASAIYAPGVDGIAGTATFTNGATSMLFTMPALQIPRVSPSVQGKSEIRLPLQGFARKSASTKELTITLDSTP